MKRFLAAMGLAAALPLAGQTAQPAERQARETIAASFGPAGVEDRQAGGQGVPEQGARGR